MKSILLSLLTMFLCQCNNSHEKYFPQETDRPHTDSLMITPEAIDTPIYRPNSSIATDDQAADRNMKEQLNQYQNAVMSGNIDLAYTFFYPKVLEYLRREYPSENIDEYYIKDKVIKVGYEIIKKLNERDSADLRYLVKDVVCRFNSNNTLIYLINTSMDGTVNGEPKTVPTKTVGISNDNGKTWKFLTQGEETQPILTEEFGLTIANQIMNCQ